MSRFVATFRHPERFVSGVVGEPGERVFFVQVVDEQRTTTLQMEKEQTRLLGDRINQLLDDVAARQGISLPGETNKYEDHEPLATPIESDFHVGSMGLGWNVESEELIVECHAGGDDDTNVPDVGSDSEDGPDTLRVILSANYGRQFAARALALVAAGRPNCPFCSNPLDPRGHICPRANGYRR